MSSSSTASKLEGLIGLGSAKRVVAGLVKSQIHTHAILFYGAEGSGKEELARVLSEYWLCTHAASAEGADGTCPACVAFARDRSPDLLTISPQGPSNLITIKQLQPRPAAAGEPPILSLEEFIRTQPLMSRHKVVIISDADRMNSATSNSLLKTLEEPPSFVNLILTTKSTGGVAATILSRVLAVPCALPTDQEIALKFPAATRDDIMISESAPSRIAEVLKNPEPFREAVAFARDLPHRRVYEALVVAENFRGVAERFDGALQCGMRQANAEVLRIISLLCTRDPNFPGHWGASFVEAHERIIANGQSSLVTDALFAKILNAA
jgi:DNA polymerase-3 subunit delta'